MDLFTIINQHTWKHPILVSMPHSGTHIPPFIRSRMKSSYVEDQDDTDFFLQELYAFTEAMGLCAIQSNHSRWVADLNRDPHSKPLYDDGRVITDVITETNFLGEPLYDGPVFEGEDQRSTRIQRYHRPYHEALKQLIDSHLETFSEVIVWDCHSIRRNVPTISKVPFPDFILGTFSGASCEKVFEDKVMDQLTESHAAEYNTLFKGGYITRNFGDPKNGVHTIQLEMAKDLYMDGEERKYHREKAQTISTLLEKIFTELIHILNERSNKL